MGLPEVAYACPKLYTHLKSLFILFILYDPIVHKLLLSFIDQIIDTLTENPHSATNNGHMD